MFSAYILAVFMEWSGMTEMQSSPTKVNPAPDANCTTEDRLKYLDEVIGPFVDKYCLTLPNVEDAITRQREQQIQSNTEHDDTPTVSLSILPGKMAPI